MAYQPTNSIFFPHQTSQQYFQPWLISQTSQNEQGDGLFGSVRGFFLKKDTLSYLCHFQGYL